MTTPAIRRASPDEAEALSELAEHAKRHWGYDDAFIKATRHDIAVTPEDVASHSCFLAETGGRIAGFYLLNGHALERLFVAPAFLGRGIGRALFAHMRSEAVRQGLERVEIVSDPNAAGFYRRMGAVEAGFFESRDIPGRRLPILRLSIRHNGL